MSNCNDTVRYISEFVLAVLVWQTLISLEVISRGIEPLIKMSEMALHQYKIHIIKASMLTSVTGIVVDYQSYIS